MHGIGFSIIGTRLEKERVLNVVVVEWNTGTGTAAHTSLDERQEYITARTSQDGIIGTNVILEWRERERERESDS